VFDGKLDLAKAAICRFAGRESRGFDLLFHSNAPPGSGLGSSSAMMVALIGALAEFRNLPVTD
jgi:D-glycero-alpha-D-manno-heptose-7-phosphate kinase